MVKDNIIFVLSEAVNNVFLEDDEILEVVSSINSIHIFDDVADFRQRNKISYKLGDLLLMAMIVIIKEKTQSFLYIADYISINRKLFEKYGLIDKGSKTPSHDTFRRVF